jgi:DNA modification methylase
MWRVEHGDCLDVMRGMPDNSVDAVVTDPPYGLSFMGKRWDYDVPAVEVWAECLRLLKPGGHLLAFAGTRTQHRMAVRIEDAGFEIRDMIAWVYAQGFPKSHNFGCKCRAGAVPYTHEEAKPKTECEVRSVRDADVSPTVDSSQGRGKVLQPCVQESCASIAGWEEFATAQIREGQPGMEGGGNLLEKEGQLQIDQVCSLSGGVLANGEEGRLHNGTSIDYGAGNWALPDSNGGGPSSQPRSARQSTLQPGAVCKQRGAQTGGVAADQVCPICGGLKQWSGWGTALKPAMEPITVARKPLVGTVAENVLANGTGGLNIDGCRVDASDARPLIESKAEASLHAFGNGLNGSRCAGVTTQGRWPANFIHNGSDEVTGLLGDAARFFYCPKASKADRDEGLEGFEVKRTGGMSATDDGSMLTGSGNERTTARANLHPTVKPTDLMRYLCRLVTPPGGIVLDPFTGSGSTGKAAVLEGFEFIGIEREAEYVALARARIAPKIDSQRTLFS